MISFEDNKLNWIIKKGRLTLKLKISKGTSCGLLYAPDRKEMLPKVKEYLDGNITIQLKESNKILIDHSSDNAAVEITGNPDRLIRNVK